MTTPNLYNFSNWANGATPDTLNWNRIPHTNYDPNVSKYNLSIYFATVSPESDTSTDGNRRTFRIVHVARDSI